ncbi:substrate-binding domain-containing protein [Agrobacterium vitis]|uniref:substrate-binding domain-containing protein n=1 Tax=Agrobacterium vitis TaxID=373 RepID=UPI003D2B018E
MSPTLSQEFRQRTSESKGSNPRWPNIPASRFSKRSSMTMTLTRPHLRLQAVYARNPDLAGVFGANLFSGLGSANGVQQAGQSGTIKVVAFDAPGSVVDNLKSGLIDFAIAQHPAEIGYYGVISAYAHLTGQSIPTKIGTGFTVINKSNVTDPAVARFIYAE